MVLRKLLLTSFVFTVLLGMPIDISGQSAIGFNGYVTEMPSYFWQKSGSLSRWDNLIHNRINLDYGPTSNLDIRLAFRNRFFLGETVRNNALFKYYLESDPGWMDLSFNWGTSKANIVNTVIDRLSVEQTWGEFKVKAGRQRVDWGYCQAWNPNDVFNSYSYFDFDYPERPFMDGIRMQYVSGGLSRVEAVLKVDANSDVSSALLYGFDKTAFHLQVIAGQLNQDDLLFGLGAKAAVLNADFYGELTYLSASNSSKKEVYVFSMGSNYTFINAIKISTEYLYSSNLSSSFDSFGDLSFPQTSMQNLSVTDHSYMLSLSAPLKSSLSISLAYVGFSYPVFENYYISPSIDYSLGETLSISGVVQVFEHQKIDTKELSISSFILLKKLF